MSVTAIDVLLDPDSRMVERAVADNDRLRAVYPSGFSLDARHAPHVTVLQRFVRTADLDQIESTLGGVFGRLDLALLELHATGYYYVPWQGLGLAGITIEPTGPLLDLQRSILDALAPFAGPEGGPDAFVDAPETPTIVPTAAYVATFATERTGAHYNPHVTIGLGAADYLDSMIAEPFDRFSFSASGAAIYQLGDLGTAQRLLWSSVAGSGR